jgi:hypothetical protein
MKNVAYKELINSLRLVALPFDDQLASLPSFVCPADEVALIFGDAFIFFGGSESAKGLPGKTGELLIELERLLTQMSDRQDLWSNDALLDSAEWSDCRRLAADALNELSEKMGIPDLSSTLYVKGN